MEPDQPPLIKTLLVDDDRTSLLLLSKIVEESCECTTARSGAEAIEAIRASLVAGSPFELMFIDIQLDDTDGRSLLKKVREVESKLSVSEQEKCKIIMITADRDILTRKECQSLGSDAYITKPINSVVIQTRLKMLGLAD